MSLISDAATYMLREVIADWPDSKSRQEAINAMDAKYGKRAVDDAIEHQRQLCKDVLTAQVVLHG